MPVDGAADLERPRPLQVLGLQQRPPARLALRASPSRRPASRARDRRAARGRPRCQRASGSSSSSIRNTFREDLVHGRERVELPPAHLVEQPQAARDRPRPHSPDGGAPVPRRPRTPRRRGSPRGARRGRRRPRERPGAPRSPPTARPPPRRGSASVQHDRRAARRAPSASTWRTSVSSRRGERVVQPC